MIGIILVVLCILLSLGLYLRNTMLQAQIDNMADELAQIQISKEYLEANRLMTSLDAMKEYDKGAEVALNKFNKNHVLTTDFIGKIVKAMPNLVVLNSFNMNNSGIEMSFRVPDRKVAAELVLNMKKTELFHDVQLSSVSSSQSGEGYTSSISCILKGIEEAGGLE
ncbi:MAG: PilN domain-containing protein [Anaerovoracaceae bacterium]|jgi:Tfp pilus assembly protein PilN